MQEGIKKFEELLFTDEAFQQKLKEAAKEYTGEQTEEAVFKEVLTPLAQQYGISATYEEYHDFMNNDREMDEMELLQVAGGKGGGLGAGTCKVVGLGFGGGGTSDGGGVCVALGFGYESYGCAGSGS